MPPDRIAHRVPALPVAPLHVAQMSVVVSEPDEPCRRFLDDGRGMPQHDAPDGAGLADDVAVGDDEAEADSRGDGFRQTADVDDAPARIQRPQRGGRSREVVDLRLVVVLQNEEIVLDRGFDQCPAPERGMVTMVGNWWLGVVKTS